MSTTRETNTRKRKASGPINNETSVKRAKTQEEKSYHNDVCKKSRNTKLELTDLLRKTLETYCELVTQMLPSDKETKAIKKALKKINSKNVNVEKGTKFNLQIENLKKEKEYIEKLIGDIKKDKQENENINLNYQLNLPVQGQLQETINHFPYIPTSTPSIQPYFEDFSTNPIIYNTTNYGYGFWNPQNVTLPNNNQDMHNNQNINQNIQNEINTVNNYYPFWPQPNDYLLPQNDDPYQEGNNSNTYKG